MRPQHRLVTELAFIVVSVLASTQAVASCVCRCVGGNMQPICSGSLDLPPICPPTVCAIVPPSVQPIQTPMVPPIGASNCQKEQVLNPRTSQYEWKTICR